MPPGTRLGTVPTVVSSEDPGSTLAAYAALYVEQEVRAEGLARDVGSFSRFLEAAAFSHAATLNVSELARECETSRSTVAGYLELLEDLLLSFRLPVFTRRAKRRLVAHPRFFYFDCGVYRSLRPRGFLDRSAEIAGPALEGLVAQHLPGHGWPTPGPMRDSTTGARGAEPKSTSWFTGPPGCGPSTS